MHNMSVLIICKQNITLTPDLVSEIGPAFRGTFCNLPSKGLIKLDGPFQSNSTLDKAWDPFHALKRFKTTFFARNTNSAEIKMPGPKKTQIFAEILASA